MAKVIIPKTTAGCAFEARVRSLGFEVAMVGNGGVAMLDSATREEVWLIPDAVFQGRDWARLRVELGRALRFFVVGLAGPEVGRVVGAMRDGAFEVVALTDSDARWREVILASAGSQGLWLQLYSGRLATEGARLVGRSMALEELRRDLERLGPTDVTVLLIGESGVGKERVTSALHEAGRGGPLITLNCAAMPRELIEAELFGAEKGAFTGALRTRVGLVEQASGGTLFLDEIGEMDLSLQPKLLRFLETRRARRVGGEAEYSVQLRVVAATNRDLEVEVAAGRFRADLYYRLAEVVIRLPPLRERKEDIPDLVRAFVVAAGERFGKHFDTVEPELLLRLQDYSWPGNVRELKSVVDRLVLFHDGPVLRAGWWIPPTFAAPVVGRPVGGMAMSTLGPASTAPAAAGTGGGAGSGRMEGEAGMGWEPDGLGGEAIPSRQARMALAKRLMAEGRLSLTEIAARAGVHPTTLFRWRKTEKEAGKPEDAVE